MRELTTQEKIRVIREEVSILKSRIQEHATGHIHTAISVLNHRLEELNEEYNIEQKQRNR